MKCSAAGNGNACRRITIATVGAGIGSARPSATMPRDLRSTSARVQVQTIAEYEPVVFDAKCVERVRRATAAAGYPYMEMCSGAGTTR